MNIQDFKSKKERIDDLMDQLCKTYASDLQSRVIAACKASNHHFAAGMGSWAFYSNKTGDSIGHYDLDTAPRKLQPVIREMIDADKLVEYFCSNYLEDYSGK